METPLVSGVSPSPILVIDFLSASICFVLYSFSGNDLLLGSINAVS